MSILRLLRAETKAWWWYKELRARGEVKEAEKLERASIRDKVKDLRNAYCLKIGEYGRTLYMFERTQLGHYSECYEKCCDILGIPIIDTRPIYWDNPDAVDILVRMPMIEEDSLCDLPPYGSISFAPVSFVGNYVKENGGEVRGDYLSPTARRFISKRRKCVAEAGATG